jgi:hypothetical protein
MSMMTVPVGPISPYSSDPVGDAMKAMAQVGAATISWTYWNDPQTALGQGTGRWQFKGVAILVPAGASDPVMFVVGCGGRDCSSVGGLPRAPAPSFPGMAQSKGPLSGIDFGFSPGSRMVSGGATIIRQPILASNPATIVADILAMETQYASPNGWRIICYHDKQTAVGAGSGEWCIQSQSWSAGDAALSVVEMSGCDLNSVGGRPAVPLPTNSYAVTTNMFALL